MNYEEDSGLQSSDNETMRGGLKAYIEPKLFNKK